jgi:hypothetical protein
MSEKSAMVLLVTLGQGVGRLREMYSRMGCTLAKNFLDVSFLLYQVRN